MYTQGQIQERFALWTESPYFDQATREELLQITDPKEIEDRFYTDLEFGTGGMRGVLGAGTNRMNRYLIRKITQGLADTILAQGAEAAQRGVVIAHDSRRYSSDFALESALVLAKNGIRAYLFESLRPTPELSFAVRHLKTIAGVNITASHNPKEYNGYKVYWEDGGQIPPAQASQIVTQMAAREGWGAEALSREEAEQSGLLHWVGEEIDRAYLEVMQGPLLYPALTREKGQELKIVFTPLHGTGGKPVSALLNRIGFTSLLMVREQEAPDTEFSTVKSPNPEDPAAFQMALTYAEKHQADLILATDPDADRLGLYARDGEGKFQRFTGNQIGVLLLHYLLSQKKRLGGLTPQSTVVKTVASTDLGDALALHYGIQLVNTLVGFKYIGEQIKEMEEKGWGTFLFGFEESHGYLAGTYARDKDAVQAAGLLAEAALYYKVQEGKTLPQVLDEVFQQFGYYLDEQVALSLKGKEGKEKIAQIMDRLRQEQEPVFCGFPVRSMEDFGASKRRILAEGKEEDIDLPKENVVRFSFDGGGYIMARPSGTEPKIRFYFCIKGNNMEELTVAMEDVKQAFFAKFKDLATP